MSLYNVGSSTFNESFEAQPRGCHSSSAVQLDQYRFVGKDGAMALMVFVRGMVVVVRLLVVHTVRTTLVGAACSRNHYALPSLESLWERLSVSEMYGVRWLGRPRLCYC